MKGPYMDGLGDVFDVCVCVFFLAFILFYCFS